MPKAIGGDGRDDDKASGGEAAFHDRSSFRIDVA
jgi:hypothetical protein